MKTPAYKKASLPIEDRVADLLSRMTLEEKVAQLNQPLMGWKAYAKNGETITLTEEFTKLAQNTGVGAVYGLFRADPWSGKTVETGLSPAQAAAAANLLQRFVVENTRLGIPLLLSEECPHGHMAIGSTVFPTAIMMASTWKPELAEMMGRAAAAEIRAKGGNVGYGPILDVALDPRWSRVEETFGEDPYLISRMGAAMVKGMQGTALDDDQAVISTLKHFAAYGASEGGRNGAPVHLGMRELHEVHLPGFKAAVESGAQSLMAAYNDIDGVPCSGNTYLLTDLLRSQWGFDGFVVADGTGIDWLYTQHHVAHDFEEAGALAVTAGVDLSLWDQAFTRLADAVRNNKVSIDVIDQAVRRILRAKFRLGLFEKPYVDEGRVEIIVGSKDHRDLARKIACEGIILLKNDGPILPLDKDIASIAVIGPNADNVYNQLGDYTAPQKREDIVTVLDGIKAAVSPKTIVRYALGCRIRHPSLTGFAEAVNVAKQSDLVVVVVGGSSARKFSMKHRDTGAAAVDEGLTGIDMECGEGFDRSDLDLAGVQLDMLQAIHATGTPMVVVLIQGRPYAINWIAENAQAIVNAWYPGQNGGHAVADVLFGEVNPAGRLPISIPKSAGQLPVNYNRKPSSWGNYVSQDSKPLFSFGHGLSYTTFSYANLTIRPKRIRADQTAVATVEITNTGKRRGDEVVQMYVRDEVCSFTRPVKQLKGFQRICLETGETKTVEFEITSETLHMLDASLESVVEPGEFTIMIGGNSQDVLSAGLEVIS
jgi:beta-glucosidase